MTDSFYMDLMKKLNGLQEQINALRTIEIGGIWTSYTPILSGWSSNPGGVYRYCVIGKLCTVMIYQFSSGTSDSTAISISLPITSGATGTWSAPHRYQNNGTTGSTSGMALILTSGSVINFYTGWSAGAWTESGNKRIINCVITYEIA